MKQKFITAYMKTANVFADLSSAVRLKVGAIVVKDNRIISIGYNGTPPGWDNQCEDDVIDDKWMTTLKTKPEVIHAEANCISKLAKSHESGEGASMFITHSPCVECAKLISQSGISEVFYETDYRSHDGVYFLQKCGITVTKIQG